MNAISKEKLKEPNHPAWFYQDLVEDSFPWDDGITMSFEDFDQQYTLHDSCWIGAFLNIACAQTVTLAIQWDSVWFPEKIKARLEIDGDPYMLIRLSEVDEISPSHYVDWGNFPVISDYEVVEVSGKKMLAINNVDGSQIQVVYRGQEVFLAIEKNRQRLLI